MKMDKSTENSTNYRKVAKNERKIGKKYMSIAKKKKKNNNCPFPDACHTTLPWPTLHGASPHHQSKSK